MFTTLLQKFTNTAQNLYPATLTDIIHTFINGTPLTKKLDAIEEYSALLNGRMPSFSYYTELESLGITAGKESFHAINLMLPEWGFLNYTITASMLQSPNIYPCNNGTCICIKGLNISRMLMILESNYGTWIQCVNDGSSQQGWMPLFTSTIQSWPDIVNATVSQPVWAEGVDGSNARIFKSLGVAYLVGQIALTNIEAGATMTILSGLPTPFQPTISQTIRTFVPVDHVAVPMSIAIQTSGTIQVINYFEQALSPTLGVSIAWLTKTQNGSTPV